MSRVFSSLTSQPSRPIGTPLALDPRALGVAYETAEEQDDRYGAEIERDGEIAIVRVCGPLEQYAMCFDGYESSRWRVGVVERFELACADVSSTSVMLVMDSPGGEVAGLWEAIRSMRDTAAASGKRVVAYVNEQAYSAAYAIASVAPEIYVPESGGVGSIGVIAELMDFVGMNEKYGINVAVISAGAYKSDGHPDLPISDQAIEVVSERVSTLAAQFYDAVAEVRPLDAGEVEALEAACFYGEDAVGAGLADGVMGYAELCSALSGNGATARGEKIMNEKKNAAARVAASDALAAPRIGLGPLAVIGAAGAYKKTEESTVTEETEEMDEEAGTSTETTTTTTTESVTTEEEKKDGDGDDDDKDGDGDDDEKSSETGSKDASAMIAAARTRASTPSTSRDVLAAVRRLTGQSSLGAQIGALEAMSARAQHCAKLERRLEKAEAAGRKASIAAKVDTAIRAGLLTLAQRAWAIATGTKDPAILDGYLVNAKPAVAPALRMPADKPRGSTSQPTPTVPNGLTAAEAKVAGILQVDPDKLAAFKANGSKIPTLTH
jgi:ClpP class serine protease